jgi:polyhydroxyalkanoate synthase
MTIALENKSEASTGFADALDRSLHASVGRITAGLSPAAMALAYLDWAAHLAAAPGKRIELAGLAAGQWIQLLEYTGQCQHIGVSPARCIEPLPQDHRFAGPGWQRYPFNLIHQAFLFNERWWHAATTGVRGVSAHHEAVVEFATRQVLDMFSPSNFMWTNPEVLERSAWDGGLNLLKGIGNLIDDWHRATRGDRPAGAENFEVGRNVAVTAGDVVFRNNLIELIHYPAATDKVRPEPVLIVPAWIMKYYILDLSPHNSLVRYLTKQGYNLFMMSWKNPTQEDCDLGMEDYRVKGFMAALDATPPQAREGEVRVTASPSFSATPPQCSTRPSWSSCCARSRD